MHRQTDVRRDGGTDRQTCGGTERRRDGGTEGRSGGGTEGRRDGAAEGRRDGGTEGRRDGGTEGRAPIGCRIARLRFWRPICARGRVRVSGVSRAGCGRGGAGARGRAPASGRPCVAPMDSPGPLTPPPPMRPCWVKITGSGVSCAQVHSPHSHPRVAPKGHIPMDLGIPPLRIGRGSGVVG